MNQFEETEQFCRVCGLDWKKPRSKVWMTFCPCCGCHVGHDDLVASATTERRLEWAENGYVWFHEDEKPKTWDLKKQLANIPEEFR